MRRAVAFILALCFSLMGTGVVQYLHDLQHVAVAACHDGDRHEHDPAAPTSTPGKCATCLLLHQPLVAQQLGLMVAVVPALAGVHAAAPMMCPDARRAVRLDCRGPPERSLIV